MPPIEMFIFFISFILDFYIIDIPEILRDNSDNHVTTLRREATAKKDFQEDLVVRKPSVTICLRSLQILYYPPPLPRIIQKFTN